MLNNSLGKIIATVIAMCIFYPAGTASAAPGRLPTVAEVKNMAKNQGINYVKQNILGFAKVVESGASNPASPIPYLKLTSEPSDLPYTRVPAGEEFIISVSFNTVGEAYGSSHGCSPTNYRDAESPDSVTYTFTVKDKDGRTITLSGNLEEKKDEYIRESVSLEDPDRDCHTDSDGDRHCHWDCDSISRTHVTKRSFEYRKVIKLSKDYADLGNTDITINIDGERVRNVSCDIIDSAVSGTTVKIPMQIYTPIGQTFHQIKYYAN